MINNRKGFTIVELLIVIVVIGVLVAIAIVAYTGVQARANDTKIRSAANQLEKSIMAWAVQTGSATIPGGLGSTVPPSANGCVDGVSGWFSNTTGYVCAAEDHLVAQKVIPEGFSAKLPPNTYYGNPPNGRLSLMLYKCTSAPGRYALFWTLQRPTAEETESINSVVTTCGNTQVRDTWGMRSGKIFTLPS